MGGLSSSGWGLEDRLSVQEPLSVSHSKHVELPELRQLAEKRDSLWLRGPPERCLSSTLLSGTKCQQVKPIIKRIGD